MRKILLVLVFSAICTAAFAVLQPQFKLDVTVSPSNGMDEVRVLNADTNAQLGICTNTCTFTFRSGTKLKVVGSSNIPASFGFSNWGANTGSAAACANSTNNVCNFAISQDTKVAGVFRVVKQIRVQLGTGNGLIRVKKNGAQLFDCTNTAPLSCSVGTLDGDKIRIEAIANPSANPPQQFQKFTGQTGSATVCTGQGATFFCEFAIKQDSFLVGNFIQIP